MSTTHKITTVNKIKMIEQKRKKEVKAVHARITTAYENKFKGFADNIQSFVTEFNKHKTHEIYSHTFHNLTQSPTDIWPVTPVLDKLSENHDIYVTNLYSHKYEMISY